MRDIQTVRLCSKQEKEERDKAIVDYYINNRLIAYGEVPDSVPENIPKDVREEMIRAKVEEFCLKHYREDMERIRRKYALSHSELRKLPKRNYP